MVPSEKTARSLLPARGEDHAAQRLTAGSEPRGQGVAVRLGGRRPARHAVRDRLLGHRGGFPHQDARVDRLGQQVLGAEAEPAGSVGALHFLDHVLARQIGQRARRRHQHPLRDAVGLHVEGPAKDVGKAQHVEHRVRGAGDGGGRHHVAAAGARGVVGDLRLGGGQREDDGIAPHGPHHVGGEHAAGGGAHEHVGAAQALGEVPRSVLTREGALVVVEIAAIGAKEPVHVVDAQALRADAESDQEAGAAGADRSRAGDHHVHRVDRLLHQIERVQERRRRHHRGPVEVLVEDRDLEQLGEPVVDVEPLRRADVLQVDPAEGRLQELHRLDEPVGIGGVEFEVEHVDVGEALEENGHPFLHRLGRVGPHRAEAGHGGAVGDHPDQVPARRVPEDGGDIAVDLLGRDTRRREGRPDASRAG